jgi:ACS family hexuronate transporter-like MFS transporter
MKWFILSLLFVATTINYLDRAILGVLLPEIRRGIHIRTDTYGLITFWFQIAYALGSLIGGKLLDKYGTRIGFGLAAALWSVAATLNAFAASALQFGMLRMVLGLGEAANFPACNKAAAELYKPSQRATVMGVVHFGANLANVFGPALFIWLAMSLGWRTCFAFIGIIGFLWLPLWFRAYRISDRSANGGSEVSALSLKMALRYRQTWGYAWAKFLTDPVWWFYLFWIPIYLNDVRHFSASQRATALTAIYAIASIGAMLGGVSGHLIKCGWNVGKARKTVMLVCACAMPFTALGVFAQSAAMVVLFFGISMAFHAAWMTNLFTTPADVFPKEAVGVANGFGVCIGALGGALFSGLIPGYVIPVAGYIPVLLVMSCFYLIAFLLFHKNMGNLEPVEALQDNARQLA